jgi:hypothetical protein
MDRISDSGSEDVGSNPAGITKKEAIIKPLFYVMLLHNILMLQ